MSNDVNIEERLSFMLIDEASRSALRELRAPVSEALPSVLDAFYDHIRRWPQVAKFFPSEAAMTHASQKQTEHWNIILRGEYGPEYINSVGRIGRTHAEIGLEPRWYLAGYNFIIARILEKIAEDCYGPVKGRKADFAAAHERYRRLTSAFTAAAMMDVDFVISVYLAEGEHAKQSLMDELADTFEGSVAGIVDMVTAAAGSLEDTAKSMSVIAETTAERATTVSAAAEEATTNVTVVAGSADEMGKSVDEIAGQVSHASQIAAEAVTTAQSTNVTITSLSKAADKIGEVVSMISDIAAQTNLLALNATIESARAGEAGRGFAVVASEVKSLATQTAKATDDIAAQISEMQAITNQSVEAIGVIQRTIDEINNTSMAINAAVEEQSSATKEIARNTQEAASGTQDVTSHIAGVQEGAAETGAAAGRVVSSSEELGRQAEELKEKVGDFLSRIRAA